MRRAQIGSASWAVTSESSGGPLPPVTAPALDRFKPTAPAYPPTVPHYIVNVLSVLLKIIFTPILVRRRKTAAKAKGYLENRSEFRGSEFIPMLQRELN